MPPSEHLSWAELACHDGTPYPERWRASRLPPLARAFEAIRALWGRPVVVTSGYRSPAYNRQVGGARYSQHVQGRALDLTPPAGVTVRAFYDAIVDLARTQPGLGIRYVQGYARGWVHVDTRPMSTVRVVWGA